MLSCVSGSRKEDGRQKETMLTSDCQEEAFFWETVEVEVGLCHYT